MLRVVGVLITILLQIYQRIGQRKNFEIRLRFDRDITMSMVSTFLCNTMYMPNTAPARFCILVS